MDVDPSQYHNIRAVRLSEDDDHENPPVITAHWEGFGYDILNASPKTFSNFSIKRNFKGSGHSRDFDPAIKHVICQARGYDAFEQYGVDKAQETLDTCRIRNNLPEVTFKTNKTVR